MSKMAESSDKSVKVSQDEIDDVGERLSEWSV